MSKRYSSTSFATPKPKKVAVQAIIKLRAYPLIADAIERGVNWGWHYAHKHDEKPSEEAVKHQIETHVMNELCEVMEFGDE